MLFRNSSYALVGSQVSGAFTLAFTAKALSTSSYPLPVIVTGFILI